MILEITQTLSFSWLVFLTLLLMLTASIATFAQIIRRCTSIKVQVDFAEWGRERRFHIQPKTMLMSPPPFSRLTALSPKPEFGITNGTTMLLQLRTNARESVSSRSGSVKNVAGVTVDSGSEVWHVLVRRIGDEWPATALRPAEAASSALDLFDLPQHPSLGNARRFIAQGVDVAVARRLAESFARALLPPDIGLMLDGHRMIIDFSTRRFDTIEMNRMVALSDQIADNLPARAGS